ncbi:heptaprenyl diphosphate synthase component 1 [Geobacillus sp. 44B]|uniref:heptaprenyl diphosphate synthase component 1 n=1 Tax=Saccharococcus caldoxylosilyticus TaxID=81408 RepID=UPI00168A6720|nr:heptaprenyl diphosphate synthase component 1 [Parageobacillus caldoxylosilyticus]QNU36642.1 heptaprenyl diphosphate synthase component 1 [Geobacillus sp. 44B]BDG36564.1 heptaprenyl diphosphate synthase component 1 [Parageobacillus caldoxylosilyticus]BDG40352.1 heptaprenyl diphosphate synthase component 1 [Parageobacillus caldoxylosilyticus]BDG44103.1 heptaprenyl diphosphate synthase component 1 [Parageobacillus caldoxylosilyticus]
MILKQIMKKIALLKEQIERFLHHSYLFEHIPARQIDEDRILLSLSVLEDASIDPEKVDHYIIPMMLVQIALDTHDEVTNSVSEQDDLKTRQLVVLAGDLYSGLYYDYLAKLNEIPLIRLFAEAIRDINEQKVRLYQKDIERIETLFDSVGTIESALICKMAAHFSTPVWGKFSYYYLLLRRLIAEKETFIRSGSSALFELMGNILFPKSKTVTKEQKQYLLHICNRYIDHCKEAVLNAKLQVNEMLQIRISELTGGFSTIAKKTVEEG